MPHLLDHRFSPDALAVSSARPEHETSSIRRRQRTTLSAAAYGPIRRNYRVSERRTVSYPAVAIPSGAPW